MMKKGLYACMLLVLFLVLPVTALAGGRQSGSCGEGLTWSLDANGLLTVKGAGEMAFEGNTPPWEDYKDSITALKLEEGITSIATDAFRGISGLTELTLPGTLEYTGLYAFAGCSNLKTVVLEEGAERISGYCFAEDISLKSIRLPASLTYIESYAFSGCQMDAVYLANLRAWCDATVQELHSSPLSHTAALYIAGEKVTHLVIPEGVTGVGEYLFVGCLAITELTLPSTMKSVPYRSFQECMKLKTITLSEGTENIENYAFWDCEGLTELYLPSSLTKIGYDALGLTPGRLNVYYRADRENWDELTEDCGISPKAEIYCNYNPAEALTEDLDGDGELGLKDVAFLFNCYTGKAELTEDIRARADVNGDGKVSLLDVAVLYRAYVGG